MTYRCFFALEVPEPLRANLVHTLRDISKIPGVNWVPPQNLHLTLLFLGDVKQELVPALTQIQLDSSDIWKSISMSARGIELFPAKAPRLVWVNLQAEDRSIFDLHKELGRQIRALGIELDAKALKLHITLGRIKAQLPPQVERSLIESPLDTQYLIYDQLTLYRSVLRPEGPVYSIIEQSKLR